MLEPLFSILLPLLGAYNSVVDFRYLDSIGGNFVAKWPPLSPNREVIKALFSNKEELLAPASKPSVMK